MLAGSANAGGQNEAFKTESVKTPENKDTTKLLSPLAPEESGNPALFIKTGSTI